MSQMLQWDRKGINFGYGKCEQKTKLSWVGMDKRKALCFSKDELSSTWDFRRSPRDLNRVPQIWQDTTVVRYPAECWQLIWQAFLGSASSLALVLSGTEEGGPLEETRESWDIWQWWFSKAEVGRRSWWQLCSVSPFISSICPYLLVAFVLPLINNWNGITRIVPKVHRNLTTNCTPCCWGCLVSKGTSSADR